MDRVDPRPKKKKIKKEKRKKEKGNAVGCRSRLLGV